MNKQKQKLIVTMLALMGFVASDAALAHNNNDGDFALAFKGTNPASTSTAPGSPVTLQTDNLRLEAMVKAAGPQINGGLLVYNGSGCCSGWGILLQGNEAGIDANKLSVLAGGIVVAASPASLPVGKWTRVVMERRAGVVTLTVGGNSRRNPAQEFNLGVVPANPLGMAMGATERFTLGQNFNGLIDDVKVRTLDTRKTVESFSFNDVTGYTSKGKYGAILDTSGSSWIDVDDEDDDHGHDRDD
jgi:hypothetical protein